MRYTLIAFLSLVPSLLVGQFTTSTRAPSLTPFRSEGELSSYIERILRRRHAAEIARANLKCTPIKISRKRNKVAERARYAVLSGRVTTGEKPSGITGAQVLWGNNSAATDSAGRFRLLLRNLKAGDSTLIRIRAIGYNARMEFLPLTAGDSVFVDATLCPARLLLAAAVATGVTAESPSITNVQEAGVDEGGLVKLAGDYLVILRRGRLFTVALGGGALRPVAAVNAFPPDLAKDDAWYDELLVYRDRIVVVGYSYRRRGAEVNLFRIDTAGGLRYEATYNFRANDYYSSRNYASRLVGSTLVMYTPLYFGDPQTSLPAMRRWTAGADSAPMGSMTQSLRAYRPPRGVDEDFSTLHTMITCDLAKPDMTCGATAIVGGWGRVTYASPTAMYLWTATSSRDGDVLYRLPFDGGAPTALRVAGMPIDQFSFRERDGHLDVFAVDRGYGEAMWGAEWSKGKGALVQIDLDWLGDGTAAAPRDAYRFVTEGNDTRIQNRFVGNWLLLGTGNGWGLQNSTGDTLRAVPIDGGAISAIRLPHATDRIEPMGTDAVVIGTGSGNLQFTGIDLSGMPRVKQQYIVLGAAQGELRSHGFFYRRESHDAGTMGLPIRGPSQPGFAHLTEGSASIVFVRNDGHRFTGLGNLAPTAPKDTADACVASCVDWYGNARPIFLGERVIALLGYELVEGAVRGGRIVEVSRASLLR